jgi:hypothetical protein
MGQLRTEAPLETAHAWASARRLREPIAWTLLALATVVLIIGAWELFGLPGAPRIAVAITVPAPPSAAASGVQAATTSGVHARRVSGSGHQPRRRNS